MKRQGNNGFVIIALVLGGVFLVYKNLPSRAEVKEKSALSSFVPVDVNKDILVKPTDLIPNLGGVIMFSGGALR